MSLVSARQDDMSPLGNTGRNLNQRPERRIYCFNLVIHQSATVRPFFDFHPAGRSVEQRAAVPGFTFSSSCCRWIDRCETPLFSFAVRCSIIMSHELKGHRTCFRCGDSFLLWSLVRFNCALNSLTMSAVYGI